MLNDKAEKNQLFWGKATLKIYFNAKFSLKRESKMYRHQPLIYCA